MSFDFKGPSFKPVIQEAQSMLNNGGGGNLGYFKRGKKDGEQNQKPKGDLFDGHEEDSFEHEIKEDEKDFFDVLKSRFKDFIQKIKNPRNEEHNPFMDH